MTGKVHYAADLRSPECVTVCGLTVTNDELCCGMDAQRLTCEGCFRGLGSFDQFAVHAAFMARGLTVPWIAK